MGQAQLSLSYDFMIHELMQIQFYVDLGYRVYCRGKYSFYCLVVGVKMCWVKFRPEYLVKGQLPAEESMMRARFGCG